MATLQPAQLQGQLVFGRLTDGITRSPVAEADVVLLSDAREVVARGLSDAKGRYAVRLQEAGIFFLTVSRIGYAGGDTVRIIVPDGNTAYVDLDLRPEGVELPGIVVTASRLSSSLGRTGFFKRQRRGLGTFLDVEDLSGNPGSQLVDHLRRIGGITVRGGVPYVLRNQGLSTGITLGASGSLSSCAPTLLLDGLPMDGGTGDFEAVPLDWISGVEVYKGVSTVPAEWRHLGACGLIAVWTR